MVIPIRLCGDNFSYLVDCKGVNVVVDPGLAQPVLDALDGQPLEAILLTHHHWDHIGGVEELQNELGCRVIGVGDDEPVADGDHLEIGHTHWRVIGTPGHTKDSVCYYCEELEVLFTGDTLFHSGIGRLIEGDALTMYASLSKLRHLPPETMVYVGHDYTDENVEFSLGIMPDNPGLLARREKLKDDRMCGARLDEELGANLFMQTNSHELAAALNLKPDPVAVLAELRHRKDLFG